jgi:hypothetical protein
VVIGVVVVVDALDDAGSVGGVDAAVCSITAVTDVAPGRASVPLVTQAAAASDKMRSDGSLRIRGSVLAHLRRPAQGRAPARPAQPF